MNRLFLVLMLVILTGVVYHCESDPEITRDPGTGGGGGNNSGGDGDGSSGDDYIEGEAPDGCGNGRLTKDEACDDGNTKDGDGCQGNCLAVEVGYSCNPPGAPCQIMSKCGNGLLVHPEQCDDGNMDRGDGCNDLCMVEIGYKCDGDPSECTETICGDGKIEGAEGCDDGNDVPFDGCDGRCQLEPDCNDEGANCTSSCGDGLLINEECDDGNNIDGDGCSGDCKEEEGYECLQPDMAGGVLEVPVIYKDFLSSHPDFEPDAMGCETASLGMVKSSLSKDGKPVADHSASNGCDTLNRLEEWYDHDKGGDEIIVSTLKLFDNGNGGFVNQWGEEGERWVAYTDEQWCADASCSDERCAECAGVCIAPCTWGDAACCATAEYYDGDPFFFPIDGQGVTSESSYAGAVIGPTYGYESWPVEREAVSIANLDPPSGYDYDHNFHFTSEVRFWFQYDDETEQELSFVGDDDVWVFIANELVVDLGGIHVPLEDSVTINDLGLTHGEVYEIVVFQAERQTEGSTYRLTLSGFSNARSECRPECGDGIIGVGEQCDDGDNDGGYGECAEGCVLGEHCGDGVIQDEYEDCDDGNFFSDDSCPSSCRLGVVV